MAAVISVDVLLTFSHQDTVAADKICGALEVTGIHCWMAHRDIVPGRGYLGPVLEAADHCRAAVLIISSNTTASNIYVLERVAARRVPIIWLMIEHATPPAEFEKFRESALVIDASLPPLESHFRPLAARVQLLLSQARKEEQHRISPALAVEPNPKHGSENVSVDKIGPLRGQAAPLVAGLPPHAIDDAAIDIAVRIAVEVLSEIHTPASRIAGRDARVHPRSPLAAREQMPIAPARPKVAYPSTRPISPRSPQKHTKRNFALVVAGLSVIAFGAGALFSKQILGLLDAIAEYIRHLGIGTGLI